MTQTLTPPSTTPTATFSAAARILLVAGPLLVLVSELVAPREPEKLSEDEGIRFLIANADRLTASWVLGMLAAAVLAAAYVVIASRMGGRGRVVGRVAAVLGTTGAIGLAGHYAASLVTLDVALHDSTLVGAVEAAEDGRAALTTIPLVVLGLNLAVVLVCVAAVRAGWVPTWVIALGVLAMVGDFSPTNYNTILHAVFASVAFLFIASGTSVRGFRGDGRDATMGT